MSGAVTDPECDSDESRNDAALFVTSDKSA